MPGDSAEKLAKALSRQADALIVDLEDAVAPERKAEARKTARHWLASIESRGPSTTEIWLRINVWPGRRGGPGSSVLPGFDRGLRAQGPRSN